MFSRLKKLFHKECNPDLRIKCIDVYGEEFGKIYDDMSRGMSVGGFVETATYINMIEDVRNKFNCK